MIGRMRSMATDPLTAIAVAIVLGFPLSHGAAAQDNRSFSVIGYTDAETQIFMDALALGLSQRGATQMTRVPVNGLRAHDWFTVPVSVQSQQICPPDNISFSGGHLWQIANELFSYPTAPDKVGQAVSAEVRSRYACRTGAHVRQVYDGAARPYN